MKKKSFEKPKSFTNENFSERFLSINKVINDSSFTCIILFEPENHAINEVYSYSGCQKSLHENNKNVWQIGFTKKFSLKI